MFIVKAELVFEHKRDAQRCVSALSHTVFDRCATTHYKVEEDDDKHLEQHDDDQRI